MRTRDKNKNKSVILMKGEIPKEISRKGEEMTQRKREKEIEREGD